MNRTKLKLLFNSILLYFLGMKIKRYKQKFNINFKKFPLNSEKLARSSNLYQNLTEKWIKLEKKVLLLNFLIGLEGNLNL